MDQQRLTNWFLCNVFNLDAIQLEASVAPVIEAVPVEMNANEFMEVTETSKEEEKEEEKVVDIAPLPTEQVEEGYNLEEAASRILRENHQITLEEMIEDVEKEKTSKVEELITPSNTNNYIDFDLWKLD